MNYEALAHDIKSRNEHVYKKIYVSASASDNNDGSFESPLKTIERAKQVVKEYTNDMNGDIIVYLREGVYVLTEPLILDNSDSGRNGYRIIYKAYNDEEVVISGAMKVYGWRRSDELDIENLWEADMPKNISTRHLYVNGANAPRPKSKGTKSTGWETFIDENMKFHNKVETYKHFIHGDLDVYEGYLSTNKEMTKYRNLDSIEFKYDVGWTHCICPVDSVIEHEEGCYVKMKMPCFRDCQIKAGVQIGSPNYIENVFEYMRTPGEWYHDKNQNKLYYLADEKQYPNDMEILCPTAEKLLIFRGNEDSYSSSIIFEGITFQYTTYTEPSRTGHAEIQGNLTKNPEENVNHHSCFKTIQSAIELNRAKNIVMHDCKFKNIGSVAVNIVNGSRENKIIGCEFDNIAGSAVQLGGFNHTDAHPENEDEILKNNYIISNYIHDIGTEFKGSIGVISGYCERTVIAHNEICHIAYSGVSVGWGWGYWDMYSDTIIEHGPPAEYPRFNEPTVCKNSLIEYNHIHHVMEKLHDGGGIYTLSMQADSSVKGNYIHDNAGVKEAAYDEEIFMGPGGSAQVEGYEHVYYMHGFPGGIYLDLGSGGFTVTENIVYNAIVPILVANLCIKDRVESIDVHGNYYNIKPEDEGFPKEVADRAGLLKEYKDMI